MISQFTEMNLFCSFLDPAFGSVEAAATFRQASLRPGSVRVFSLQDLRGFEAEIRLVSAAAP